MPRIAPPDPPLSDDLVVLRSWRRTDVPVLTRACQDPEIPRWTFVPTPYTELHARIYVDGAAERMALGQGAALAVTAAANGGGLLGAVGLNVIDWNLRAADVGYWVAAWARGRGVAARALALVAGWAFETLDLVHLDLRPHRENRASHAVARRAGFAPVAAAVTSRPECDGPEMLAFARRRG